MNPATREDIREACLTRGSKSAVRYLASRGLYAGHGTCNRVVERLIRDGLRPAYGTPQEFVQEAAVRSNELLRRHLTAGMHFINCPTRLAAAMRQAGMVR